MGTWAAGAGRRAGARGTDATKAAVERGQSVLFSSGNGMRNTNSSDVFPAGSDPCRCKVPTHNLSPTANGSGPSWHLTVGAVSPVNGQPHWWHGIPVDVASVASPGRALPGPHEATPEQLTWDYAVEPTTAAYFVSQGYGVVDASARDRALATLLGAAPAADRSDVDQWMATQDAARDAYFGAP